MKAFLENTYYHNTLQQWGIGFLIVLGSILLARIVYWFIKRYVKTHTAKTESKLDDLLVDLIEEPIFVFIILIGTGIATHRLTFPDWLDTWLNNVLYVAITLTLTWLIVRIIDSIISEYVVPLTQKSENDLDDQIVPIARKGIRSILWILGILLALNNAGYDVAALLAGLGLGGLALAMAAKDTVANVFGGLTIFIDKPFKLHDRIKISGNDGNVEEIGVRSTRIRTLEGRLLIVPNHHFTDNVVENVSSEPSRKVILNLGLTYDTTPDALRKAISILSDIQSNDPGLIEKHWLSFNSFGDFALGITFIYYIKPGSDIGEVQTRVNLDVLSQFNNAGLAFAFPTQTIITETAS
jgi:MscS family membrane protein